MAYLIFYNGELETILTDADEIVLTNGDETVLAD